MKARISYLLSLTSLSISAFAAYEDDLYKDDVFDNSSNQYFNAQVADQMSYHENATSSEAMSRPFFSSRPNLSEGFGIIFSGEFLYWKPQPEGLETWVQTENHTNGNQYMSNLFPYRGMSGTISRISPKYEPGYRLTGVYQLPFDQWDLSFRWTRLKANRGGHTNEKPNQVIFPNYTDQSFTPLALSASSSWSLNFNTLELDLSRAFSLGRSFCMNTFAGFKAAWIEQNLKVHLYNVTFANQTSQPFLINKTRNNFQGYGMNIGVDGKWCLGSGFHLFGKLATALLWGEYDLAQFGKTQVPRGKLTQKVHEIQPQIEAQGGIGWEHQFSSNRCYLNFYAAFEEQIWFDQNQSLRHLSGWEEGKVQHSDGDLTFAGWTFGATLGF